MGMDVYGKSSITENGEYFRRSVWGWRPLADFIIHTCPSEITSKCESWHSNDGCGLNAEDSAKLAKLLEQKVAAGEAAAYVKARQERLDELSDETCKLCEGTGVRSDEIGTKAGQPDRVINEPGHRRDGQKGWCNGCNGNGSKRPFDTYYCLDIEDITEFTAFLKDCGGFEIC